MTKKVPSDGVNHPPFSGFEYYDASEDGDQDEDSLGLAWVRGGSIYAMPLSEYLTETPHLAGESQRADFLKRLPFKHASEVFWPLPGNPSQLGRRPSEFNGTEVPMNIGTVAEWEEHRGENLMNALETYFSRRVSVTKTSYLKTMALWSIAATLRTRQMIFAPSLLFRAPFGWGKSTAAEAVQLVVPRCMHGATITPAATYRTVNDFGSALVIDESAIDNNPDLQRVIKSGFKRGPKILRAKQNADAGIIALDPWAFLILTIQVDPRDDVMSRCLPVDLSPGAEPAVPVREDDPEAKTLRTVLMRLRLECQAGHQYTDFRTVAADVRRVPELEPRTKDKIESIWPIAHHYQALEDLVMIARDAEAIAKGQYEMSDQGLIASALQQLVEDIKGKPTQGDLHLSTVHQKVVQMLLLQGEGDVVSTDSGEGLRLPRGKYGARDFTSPILKQLGFRLKLIRGMTVIDLQSFLSVWPAVQRRYIDPDQAHPSLQSLLSLPIDIPRKEVEIDKNISTPISTKVEMVDIKATNHALTEDPAERQAFDEKLQDLQSRACSDGSPFKVAMLRNVIDFVAKTEQPSPHLLRQHLTREFPAHYDEALGMVDGFYNDLKELGDILRQIKQPEGGP